MASLWRGRVSLLGRVYVLVAVLLVLLGAVSVGTFVFRQRDEAVTIRLTTEVVPTQIAVSRLTASYSDQSSAVRGFLTTGDPTFLGAYRIRTSETANFEAIINQHMSSSPRVMSSLDDVHRAARVWREESVRPMLEQVRSQEPSAPSPADTRTSHQRFEALRAELSNLQQRINEIAVSETAAATAARTAANWLTWTAVAASLVVAAGALLFLRRSLTRPLRTFVSQVNQVTEGDLDRPVGVVEPPELNRVARAVETMRRRVLDETSRREQVQQDLARREAAERRRTEQDYATVVAALDEGVIVVGAAGAIEAANPAAHRIVGTAGSELVGSSPETWHLFDEAGEALAPEDHPSAMTRRSGQPANSRVLRLHRADGSGVWLSATSRALTGHPPHKVVVSFTDITESWAARQRLEHEATHDPLTGLANRTLVLRHCDRRSREHPLAVLYLDLDNFKRINDSLGHGAGDDVLRVVGQRLMRAAPGEALVGRIGGDEFLVLTHEQHDHDALAALSEHLLAVLTEPVELRGRQLHITGSIGIVVAPPGDGRRGQELLRDTDVAMYQAKNHGGRWTFFDVQLRERVQRHMALEQDLRHAAAQNQLWVAYQPLVDLRTERTVAAEGLLRWSHPEHGAVSPGEFIPIAEESDLIRHVGTYMLRTATHQIAAQRRRHSLELQLNANLSPRQLGDPQLQALVQQSLATAALPAGALCLEITEETIMQDPAQATRVLNELRGLGVELAIDDFGTGYSSLAELQRLPLDALKIDRSFVTDLGNSRDLEAIVTSIIAMAHAVDLTVVAEGVETAQQLELLAHLGCDQAQGYYLGKPAPCNEFPIADRLPRHGDAEGRR